LAAEIFNFSDVGCAWGLSLALGISLGIGGIYLKIIMGILPLAKYVNLNIADSAYYSLFMKWWL